MAKGTGLIGNFKGKVGNTVGYKLSASNNGQTQGIRVYQPIVKNPKTAAQAEQRAKLLAVNATYRALKMVIDRGNEGLPYGNKSRLAWLKGALKAQTMPWFEKGSVVNYPVLATLTKGSLGSLVYNVTVDGLDITCTGLTGESSVATIGAISTALLAAYPLLKEGDQITIVTVGNVNGELGTYIQSFIVKADDTNSITGFTASAGHLEFEAPNVGGFGAIIVSREGVNGEHLRSTAFLKGAGDYTSDAPYDADSKAAAIDSYRASAASNSDWAEESIQ